MTAVCRLRFFRGLAKRREVVIKANEGETLCEPENARSAKTKKS